MRKKIEKKYKFIIVSPRQIAGGSIVLHLLCKELEDLGYNSKVFYFGSISEDAYRNKILFIKQYILFFFKDLAKLFLARCFKIEYAGYTYQPVRNIKRKYTPIYNKSNTIVIYPEIIYGNFLKGKNVVRYLLYYSPFKNVLEAYNKNDLFVCYREIFNNPELNPNVNRLNLRNFDSELYRQYNFGKRKGSCYIVRKGKNRNDLPNTFDGVVVDMLPEKEKVAVFNTCEYCYCYDLQTFYSTIACVCGCKVIIVPEDGKTRKDYLTINEKAYGVAYGTTEAELKYANETRSLVLDRINNQLLKNKAEVENFCNLCEQYFN